MLGAARHFKMHAQILELLGQFLNDDFDIFLALGALHAHQTHQLVESLGVEIAQREILQLPLDGVHAQPMGQRRVDVQRLPGDGNLPFGLLELQRAHVVQPVGQLDEHHADVLGHGQEHLAQRLGLRLLPRGEVELAQLGHAVHQQLDLLPELLADDLSGHAVHVLHAVVQKPGGDGGRVQHQVGEDDRHGAGMAEIGIARLALLVGVGMLRKGIGPAHQLHVVVRMVFANFGDQLVDADIGFPVVGHRFPSRRRRVKELCFRASPGRAARRRWSRGRSCAWAAGRIAPRGCRASAESAACREAPAPRRCRR